MKKIIVLILALLIAAVIGLQLFLAYGLTDSLRKWVLPLAQERFKLDVALDHVSVNLLAGAIAVHDLKVANPPGFAEPELATVRRFALKVGLPALFTGGIAEINKLRIGDAVITVIRNREGALNLKVINDAMAGDKSAAPGSPAPGGGAPAPTTNAIPEIVIRKMECKSLVYYIDHTLSDPPFRLGFDLNLQLKDVANYGNEEVLSGTVNLLGAFLAENKKCAFDLNGNIAPIIDPARLSFDVAGAMQAIDLKAFQPLLAKQGIEGGEVSGTITLLCRKGVFDPEKSVLRLTLNRVQLSAERKQQLGNFNLPAELKLVVPVEGTLSDPRPDFKKAFQKARLSDDGFHAILNSVMEQKGIAASNPPAGKPAAGAPAADKGPDLGRVIGDILGKTGKGNKAR